MAKNPTLSACLFISTALLLAACGETIYVKDRHTYEYVIDSVDENAAHDERYEDRPCPKCGYEWFTRHVAATYNLRLCWVEQLDRCTKRVVDVHQPWQAAGNHLFVNWVLLNDGRQVPAKISLPDGTILDIDAGFGRYH